MIHQRLADLEAISRRLDPDAVNRAALRDPVIAYAERFLESLASRPTYLVTPDKGRGLLDTPIGEDGIGIDRVIDLVERQVDRPGLNPASGGHFGYIPGGGLYASSLGDYLADIGNRYAGVFFSSPGAVYLEHQLVRWMADLLGLPASAGGTLTSGGSLANLTAIVTARDHHDIRAGDVAGTVVYVSTQTHHCVAKALRIVGLGECVTRYVPLDASHRMRPDALKTMVREDRDAGLSRGCWWRRPARPTSGQWTRWTPWARSRRAKGSGITWTARTAPSSSSPTRGASGCVVSSGPTRS